MNDLISRQAAIDEVARWEGFLDEDMIYCIQRGLKSVPSAQPTMGQVFDDDCVSRRAAIEVINAVFPVDPMKSEYAQGIACGAALAKTYVEQLPSTQLEQRYTEEELMVFRHGISLSLLSKRSAQHWRYNEDTATEIEFLERLYDKVSADMKGGQG